MIDIKVGGDEPVDEIEQHQQQSSDDDAMLSLPALWNGSFEDLAVYDWIIANQDHILEKCEDNYRNQNDWSSVIVFPCSEQQRRWIAWKNYPGVKVEDRLMATRDVWKLQPLTDRPIILRRKRK